VCAGQRAFSGVPVFSLQLRGPLVLPQPLAASSPCCLAAEKRRPQTSEQIFLPSGRQAWWVMQGTLGVQEI
jgi:hypothetical protein